MAEKITIILRSYFHFEQAESFLTRIAFIELEDFKSRIWEAQCFSGRFKGHSVQKLHENLQQSIGKTPEKCRQKDLRSIYFSQHKSPQKLGAYLKVSEPKKAQHPTGPGGTQILSQEESS